jgi:hypothetical protein
MRYWYSIPVLGNGSDAVRAFMDDIGLNLNPSIIWNAIPWTFVIDWVVNVSSWLDQFKFRNIEPITYIGEYCWSMHIRRVTSLSMGRGSAYPIIHATEDAYKRQVCTPNYVSSIKTSGLNLKEFSLAAALGVTRKKVRR